MFSGGIFVMAAGILRCVLIVTVRSPPPSLFHTTDVANLYAIHRLVQTAPNKPAAGPAAKPSSPSSSATSPWSTHLFVAACVAPVWSFPPTVPAPTVAPTSCRGPRAGSRRRRTAGRRSGSGTRWSLGSRTGRRLVGRSGWWGPRGQAVLMTDGALKS